jgi:hypothetical protein
MLAEWKTGMSGYHLASGKGAYYPPHRWTISGIRGALPALLGPQIGTEIQVPGHQLGNISAKAIPQQAMIPMITSEIRMPRSARVIA